MLGAGFAPTSGCPATVRSTKIEPLSLSVMLEPLADTPASAVMVVAVTKPVSRFRPATLAVMSPAALLDVYKRQAHNHGGVELPDQH